MSNEGIQGQQGIQGIPGQQGLRGATGDKGPVGDENPVVHLVDDRSILRQNVHQIIWIVGAVLVLALATAIVTVVAVLQRNSKLEDDLACLADRAAVDVSLGDAIASQGEGKILILNGLQGVADGDPAAVDAALSTKDETVASIEASSKALEQAVSDRSLRLADCLNITINTTPTTEVPNGAG